MIRGLENLWPAFGGRDSMSESIIAYKFMKGAFELRRPLKEKEKILGTSTTQAAKSYNKAKHSKAQIKRRSNIIRLESREIVSHTPF